jgi:hypothetical protein
LRENPRVSTDADAKAKSPRGYILLLGVGAIFLLLLALVAGGVWWFAGGNNFSNQAQDIKIAVLGTLFIRGYNWTDFITN